MPRIVLQELDSDKALSVGELDTLVGRDPACGLVVDGLRSKVVSGRHARIFFQDGAWWIQDMSRNGTILDDERLQSGQRHALRAGQVIGLGESGPRLRVTTLESRNVAETMVEPNVATGDKATTAPRVRPKVSAGPAGNPQEGTTAFRPPLPEPESPQFEESTEPAKLSGDWHISLVFRATHSDQRFEASGAVVRVGRSPECNVRIPPEQGASVSRVHAEISIGESGVVIRDAGSRNGTFVNGNRIQGAHPLMVGDRVMLGSGGPTLEMEDLHILRGEGPPPPVGHGIGGGATPDAMTSKQAASQPFREPPTAPAPHEEGAIAATRVPNARVASPPRGQPRATPQTAPGERTAGWGKAVLLVVIGIVVLAAAVIIGRVSAQ